MNKKATSLALVVIAMVLLLAGIALADRQVRSTLVVLPAATPTPVVSR